MITDDDLVELTAGIVRLVGTKGGNTPESIVGTLLRICVVIMMAVEHTSQSDAMQKLEQIMADAQIQPRLH